MTKVIKALKDDEFSPQIMGDKVSNTEEEMHCMKVIESGLHYNGLFLMLVSVHHQLLISESHAMRVTVVTFK